MEKRQFCFVLNFQQVTLEQLNIHTQKINLDIDLTPFTKINSKWIIDLNIKGKILKLLRDSIRENLDDLGQGNDFIDSKGIIHNRNN